jgi:hypothetical protein
METNMRILLLALSFLLTCSLVNAAEAKKKKDEKPTAGGPTELVGFMMSKPGSAAADIVCLINVKNGKKVTSWNLKASTPEIAKKLTTFLEKKTPLVKITGKAEETFFMVESAEETDKDPNAQKKK